MVRSFWRVGSFLTLTFLLLVRADPSGGQAQQSKASAQVERLWADLADQDAPKAFQAITSSIRMREQTVAFLTGHLQPASAPDPAKVEQWIKDLNSAHFAVRAQGNKELENLGGLAEGALRKALQGKIPLEVQRRLDNLLNKLSGPLTLAEQLRAARAVEILEHIGSDQATGLLKQYAAGAPGARLTEDAREAVARLQKQPADSPALPAPNSKPGTDLYGDPLPAGAVARLGTIRFRRDSSFGLTALHFLRDGKTILTADEGHAVQLWDAASGLLLRELRTEPLSIINFALAPDSKHFAVAGFLSSVAQNVAPLREIRIFAFPSGKLVRTIGDQDSYRTELAFSPDSKLLFTLESNGVLRALDIDSGKQVLQRKFPPDNSGQLAVSPDGRFLAITTGVNTHKFFLWEWQGKEPRQLEVPHHGAQWVSFSANGKLLATVGDLGLRVWEVPSGRLLYQRGSPDPDYYYRGQPTFAPDGKLIGLSLNHRSGSGRGKTELLDPITGTRKGVLEHSFPITGTRKGVLEHSSSAISFSPDSGRLACAHGCGVRIWDLASRKELGPKHEGHSSDPTHILVSRKGFLVTTGYDNSLRIWHAATSRQKRAFSVDNWVRDIALSPDGNLLAASSLDDAVHLWNTGTGREIYRLAGHGRLGRRRTLGFLPDGKGLLSWGDDLFLRLWDMKTGKARFEHAIRPKGVKIPDEDDPLGIRKFEFGMSSAAMTPNGKMFIWQVGSDFHLFNTATGKETRKFQTASHIHSISTVSADSKRLLVSSYWANQIENHPIYLIDLSSGKVLQQFILPGWANGPVAFSADGRVFATAVAKPQKEIRLYEIASGKARYVIRGFRGGVRSLAFFPDGSRLASGHSDSTLLIWDLNSPVEIAKGK